MARVGESDIFRDGELPAIFGNEQRLSAAFGISTSSTYFYNMISFVEKCMPAGELRWAKMVWDSE